MKMAFIDNEPVSVEQLGSLASTSPLPPIEWREVELVRWQTGTPDVKEHGQARFWCAVKPRGMEKVYHRFLTFCNRYVMPLGDDQYDPPKGCEPVPGSDGEEFYWTGWFEEACEHCDMQWTYDGEVVAWMKLPRLPQQ